MRHVDIVANAWESYKQVRIGRVYEDMSHDKHDESWRFSSGFTSIADVRRRYFGGTYVVVTELHEMDECPFKDSNSIEMGVHNL